MGKNKNKNQTRDPQTDIMRTETLERSTLKGISPSDPRLGIREPSEEETKRLTARGEWRTPRKQDPLNESVSSQGCSSIHVRGSAPDGALELKGELDTALQPKPKSYL